MSKSECSIAYITSEHHLSVQRFQIAPPCERRHICRLVQPRTSKLPSPLCTSVRLQDGDCLELPLCLPETAKELSLGIRGSPDGTDGIERKTQSGPDQSGPIQSPAWRSLVRYVATRNTVLNSPNIRNDVHFGRSFRASSATLSDVDPRSKPIESVIAVPITLNPKAPKNTEANQQRTTALRRASSEPQQPVHAKSPSTSSKDIRRSSYAVSISSFQESIARRAVKKWRAKAKASQKAIGVLVLGNKVMCAGELRDSPPHQPVSRERCAKYAPDTVLISCYRISAHRTRRLRTRQDSTKATNC